jgi:phenylalanine ammonia-lyase
MQTFELENSESAATLTDERMPTTINGESLTIQSTYDVAHRSYPVEITWSDVTRQRVHESHQIVVDSVCNGQVIYGVNTGFGGMADVIMSGHEIEEVQNNMLWTHKAGAGKYLPIRDVRAAMLLRANSHLRGSSGIRLQLIERMVTFLNEGVTPCVPELGSIGASGDLVPLSYIAGCIIGHEAGYCVHYEGEIIPAREALDRLGLPCIALEPKEALAMLNGTSVMTGVAAICVAEAKNLLTLTLHVHALMFQGLCATTLSFHPYIHRSKPHRGQVWVAEAMTEILRGSCLLRSSDGGKDRNADCGLVQDRYSLRCLPQYLGPIFDGLNKISADMEVEMNSTSDNPLIDVETKNIYYGGNFLGEYIGIGMDQLRYFIGLAAKHLDVQISMLVEPRFSNGLPPCLIGNEHRRVNMGLKALQIVGNSIMPIISFLGNSIADRFPTHAEQYNQNINSQGFGSANLARQSVDLFRQYLSLSLIFGVQSVDLRAKKMHGGYNAEEYLSPSTRALYTAVRELTGRPADEVRPWLWDDDEQHLDVQVASLVKDLESERSILFEAMHDVYPPSEIPLRQVSVSQN